VADSEQSRRGSSAAAPAPSGGRPTIPGRPPRSAPVGTFRTVIGVGPGTRPAARLSPVAPGSAQGLGRAAGPRPAPAQPPRPMHPPIGRVPGPAGVSRTAVQVAALAARQAPSAGPGRPGLLERPGGPGAKPGGGASRAGFGMPSLRRNICPHFFMTGSRGAMPIQAPHLLKALVRQEANVSRCQLRGGVHLEQGYVNDVCLSARFNQCVFYEDELTR
jgi:hypothetical protein